MINPTMPFNRSDLQGVKKPALPENVERIRLPGCMSKSNRCRYD